MEQCTYRTFSGALYYVQEIIGQKVVYCRVGDINRLHASLGRFAAIMEERVPNQ